MLGVMGVYAGKFMYGTPDLLLFIEKRLIKGYIGNKKIEIPRYFQIAGYFALKKSAMPHAP